MNEVSTRVMREEDVLQILEIEGKAFSTPWSETAFIAEIHKPYAFNRVLMIGSRIAGYLCANLILNEGHILNLAVRSEFRRRGVASWLMRETCTELKKKGCRVLYLEVRSSNAPAKKFYEKLGFKVAGLRKHYYVNPIEDAALMMRQL